MTDDQLSAIRKRCEKATLGPWTLGDFGGEVICEADLGELGIIFVATVHAGIKKSPPIHDFKFLAYAREDIPKLLDEIDRLRGLLRGDAHDR